MQNSSTVPFAQADHRDDAEMFDLAPVSLWLEDYSGVKRLFDAWRQDGVTDCARICWPIPHASSECSEQIKVLKVNRATLRCSRRTTCRTSLPISGGSSATTC